MMNRIKYKLGSAAAIAVAFFMMLTPVSVHAQVNDECFCAIKCSKEDINPHCDVCQDDYLKCEGLALSDDKDEEKYGPLTPDGNLTLVDDYGSTKLGGKQFITVVSKTGKYFYIIIDRDDKGDETVHFLNMVDESDLLALMDEDQVDEYIAVTRNKKVEPVVTEPVKEEKEPEVIVEEKKSTAPAVILIMLMMLGGGAGYVYYSRVKENKEKEEFVDPDADYIETENYDDAFDIEADDAIDFLDDEDDIEDLDKSMNAEE